MTTPTHLRQVASRTALDGIAEALREGANTIEQHETTIARRDAVIKLLEGDAADAHDRNAALVAVLSRAREFISLDRQSLADCAMKPDNTMEPDDASAVAEYDDMLSEIDAAISGATTHETDQRAARKAGITQTLDQVLDWLATGRTGVSSKCMAMWLGFGKLTSARSCPADPGDLDRCLGLLSTAPGLRQEINKMATVSEQWSRLVSRWDEIEASHLEEVGLGWRKADSAPKTYALMRSILD